MASAAPLKDIDEQFLQCCICMDQLKEPKLLPCLHRYCRGCLNKIVKENGKMIECPTCREQHTLPEGVEGLKTDFNTKNIIEFIQLQNSVKREPQRVCAGCTKTLKVSAYCFKCNDFLCQGCHVYHTTIKILKDHREHVFSLSEVEARNLTVEKLSSLKEPPRCHNHPQKLSELCCTSCGNIPICMPCTYGAHQGHDLKEVSTQAKIERERLNVKVADLMQYKDKIYEMRDQTRYTKEKLYQTVANEKQKLQEQLDTEEETIKRGTQDADKKLVKWQNELEKRMRKKTSTRKQKLEKIIREAKEKYEKICTEERWEADCELKKMQEECNREKAKLQERLDTTNKNINKLLTSLNSQVEENRRKIDELSDHFHDIVERFETVTKTASSILAARNDWADIQCIPDICAAIDPLIKDVKKVLPGLLKLSDVTIGHLVPNSGRIKVAISDKEESVVAIPGICEGQYISGIATSKNGIIIFTGMTTGQQSHFSVIDRNGKYLRQDLIQLHNKSPACYCYVLSEWKVASVSQNREVGIYDIRDGTYRKADYKGSDSIGVWTSVAVDSTNGRIIVGGQNSRKLYVYNEQLQCTHTLTLPKGIDNLYGITVHNGNILACDNISGRAYAFTTKGSRCTVVYKFAIPGNVGDCFPCSVCADKNGLIYMLWVVKGSNKNLIAQYSQDGGQLLAMRMLDDRYYGQCIAVADTEQGEKLLMATFETGKLITYALK